MIWMAGLTSLIIGLSGAEAPQPMSFIDLLSVPALSDPQLSPDGASIVYVQDAPDWKENRRIGHLWRIPAEGGPPLQLTRGRRGESSPRWCPDGLSLAFLSRRREGEDDDMQAYLLSTAGGDARPLTTHATAVSAIQWSPDGTRLYFLASDPRTAEQKAREKQEDDVYGYDEHYTQRHLWFVTPATGEETRVTEGDYSVLSYRLSADGQAIVIERAPTPLFGDAEHGEVVVLANGGAVTRALTSNQVAEEDASFSPDGRTVLFLAGANANFDTYYQSTVFTVAAAGGRAATPLMPRFPYEVLDADWKDDGTVLIVANTGVRAELFEVDLADPDHPRQLTDGNHTLHDWSYARRLGRHVFQLDDAGGPGEIWTLGTTSGSLSVTQPKLVTHIFGYLTTKFQISREEAVTWKGDDGQILEGLLFYPVDYQAGRRYPLVVQTHGGPASSDKFGWGSRLSYAQVLAGKGFAVFRPNYRGSTGYGNAFLRDMVGAYFRHAHLDVLTGVDALIARGIADPDRLAKMGWSAGGHMTNKIITFTDRFKAASSGAGAADWVSMYAQSDVRSYRTPWFGGTPWQADAPIEVYWENSPLKYVSRVKTPTLFFVGEDDPRVPMPQSVEMFRALTSLHVPTHLYVAPREGHGWQELRHQLSKYNLEMGWFERYVRGGEFTPEQAREAPSADGPRP